MHWIMRTSTDGWKAEKRSRVSSLVLTVKWLESLRRARCANYYFLPPRRGKVRIGVQARERIYLKESESSWQPKTHLKDLNMANVANVPRRLWCIRGLTR